MSDRFYEYLLLEKRPLDRNWLRLIGVLAPVFLALYAMSAAASGRAFLTSGRGFMRQSLELRGFDALLYAICLLAVAVGVHVYCFVDEERLPYYRWMQPILVGALGAFAVAIFWLAIRQLASWV